MSTRDPGPVPSRWLKCPRMATALFADKFMAFKTPLGPQFNSKVPEGDRFTPAMFFNNMRTKKIKLGLWIDLTNTNRFYDKKEVEDNGCRYVKMQCRGHGETPSLEQTKEFIHLVTKFMSQHPLEKIGVHCTHGFNRTGFLLVSYMVDQMDCSIEVALNIFATVRPPGIYKQDYLQELYQRYDDEEYTPPAPPRPQWCIEEEQVDYDDDENKPGNSSQSENDSGHRSEPEHTNKTFMAGVTGVHQFTTKPRVTEIQRKAQKLCGWKKKGFPGSQPVSMTMSNLKKLNEKPYRVSWKADGVRYMMLIDGPNEVYMLDRDNCVFHVPGLKFVNSRDLTCHLKDTLIDGEMVEDKVNGVSKFRYLCYDVIAFEGKDVGSYEFYPKRLTYIEKEIVEPRHQAMAKGIINQRTEPFSVRLKQFWDLPSARQLLGEKFAKTLSHEPDGLIFQPAKERYVPGTCEDVLKWKPSELNSIDFKLKIETESGLGILPKKVGSLYVGGHDKALAQIKLTKELKKLNNKIIECKVENNQWVFMRERNDKSFPNGYNTAKSVFESIANPVTKEILLDFIDRERFHDDSDIMPPPKRVRR